MIITKDTLTFGIQIYPDFGSEVLNSDTVTKQMDMKNYLDYNVSHYKLTCLSQPNNVSEYVSPEHVCLVGEKNQLGIINDDTFNGVLKNFTPISSTDLTFYSSAENLIRHRKKRFPELIINNWNSKILDFKIVALNTIDPLNSNVNCAKSAWGGGDDVLKSIVGQYYTFGALRNIFRSGLTYYFKLEPYDIETKSIIERPLTKTLCMVISSRDRDITKYQYGNEFSINLKPINGGYKYYKALISSFTTRFHTTAVRSTSNHVRYDLFSYGLNKANYGYGGFHNYFEKSYDSQATYMGSFMTNGVGYIQDVSIHNQVTNYNTNILTIEDNLGYVEFKTFVPNGMKTFTERQFYNGVWYETGVVYPDPLPNFTLEDGFEWLMVLNLYGFN